MMTLKLDEMDVGVLKVAMDTYLSQTREEMAHTDDRDYRNRLHEQVERLDRIRKQLDQPAASDEASGDESVTMVRSA